jgi:uncharacterized membrane protein YedE/YeeE
MNGMSEKLKYWNPYLGGALLGILLFLSFFVVGHGLGASGGVNRIAVALEDIIVPEHVDKTAYLARLAGGDRDPLRHWIVLEVAGVMLGGFVSGLLRGRVKLQTFHGPQISTRTRWAFAFAGGLLMGYGARLARGCTSGQALSGGAVMSVGSWTFMFAVFAGGYALAWFVKRLWQPEG